MRPRLTRHGARGTPSSSHRRLVGVLLRGRRGRLAALGVLLGVSSALPLAGPQLLRAFIDQAAARRPLAVLGLIAGGYVAVALTRQVLAVAATYGATQLAWAASNDLRATLVRHSLELDLSFHGIHPPGEMLKRVDGDATAVSSFVSSFLLRVVGSGLTLVGVLAVILLEDWRVGLGLVGFAAVAAVTIGRMRNSAVPQATVSGTSTPWTLMAPNQTGVTQWTPGAGRRPLAGRPRSSEVVGTVLVTMVSLCRQGWCRRELRWTARCGARTAACSRHGPRRPAWPGRRATGPPRRRRPCPAPGRAP